MTYVGDEDLGAATHARSTAVSSAEAATASKARSSTEVAAGCATHTTTAATTTEAGLSLAILQLVSVVFEG